MKTKIPKNVSVPGTEAPVPTAEEIAKAQEEAEQAALHNAIIVGKLTVKAALEITDLKAEYYKKMNEAFIEAGFSKEEAFEITKNLKI